MSLKKLKQFCQQESDRLNWGFNLDKFELWKIQASYNYSTIPPLNLISEYHTLSLVNKLDNVVIKLSYEKYPNRIEYRGINWQVQPMNFSVPFPPPSSKALKHFTESLELFWNDLEKAECEGSAIAQK